ncbi:MAG: hypothetical protein WA634_14360 [Silvibacterium sp.]
MRCGGETAQVQPSDGFRVGQFGCGQAPAVELGAEGGLRGFSQGFVLGTDFLEFFFGRLGVVGG